MGMFYCGTAAGKARGLGLDSEGCFYKALLVKFKSRVQLPEPVDDRMEVDDEGENDRMQVDDDDVVMPDAKM